MVEQDDMTRVLDGLGLDAPTIKVHSTAFGKVTVEVTSPTFKNMPEHERQRLVWEAIANKLDPNEQRAIEFVFTNAPGEDTSEDE